MPEHLLSQWHEVAQEIAGKKIVLFLDYDGTLTPIAQTPERATISPLVKKQLVLLRENLAGRLAIVSGRRLADIKKKVRVSALVYVGNHGLEIAGPGFHFNSVPLKSFSKEIGKIETALRQKLQHIKGLLLEDKGIALSVHYRLVTKKDVVKVKKIFWETLDPYLRSKKVNPALVAAKTMSGRSKGLVKVITGKKVLEIRPPVDWHKGKAVLWLLKKFGVRNKNLFPVYIGDDTTDEDVFGVLRTSGLTVFVGPPRCTQARYYLKNTAEVTTFLERLYTLWKEGSKCPEMK